MGDSIGDIYPTIVDVGAYPLGDATMENMTSANFVYVGGLAHLENLCLYFNLCCTPFGCDSEVTVSATFCNENGDVVTIDDCKFTTNDCNYIETIEIIDSRHIVVRFANRMLANPALNPLLYDPTAWSVVPVSGGFVSDNTIEVKNIFVAKELLPKLLIIETVNPMITGQMYDVSGNPNILDIHRQLLINKGKSSILGRKTRLDSILNKLPKMYKKLINTDIEDNHKLISIWQIFAVISIEDERMGGDY